MGIKEMTPYEKALRESQRKTCISCPYRAIINDVSYCKENGKIIHPMLLEQPYGDCPIEVSMRKRKDG